MEYIDGWQLDSDYTRNMGAERQISVVRILMPKEDFRLTMRADKKLSPCSPCPRHRRRQSARLAFRSDDPHEEPAHSS